MFIRRTDVKAEILILQPPYAKSWLNWCWERFKAEGEGDDRGWDGWMASLTQWTWVWVNSRSWWWTERPGVLRFMGSQRVGHDWATELNWMHSTFTNRKSLRSGCIELNMRCVKISILLVLLTCFFIPKIFSLHIRKNGQNFSLHIRKKRTKLATDDILKSAVSFIWLFILLGGGDNF